MIDDPFFAHRAEARLGSNPSLLTGRDDHGFWVSSRVHLERTGEIGYLSVSEGGIDIRFVVRSSERLVRRARTVLVLGYKALAVGLTVMVAVAYSLGRLTGSRALMTLTLMLPMLLLMMRAAQRRQPSPSWIRQSRAAIKQEVHAALQRAE